MAFPAPDYAAGGPDIDIGPALLFKHAGLFRRYLKEVQAETSIDVMKLYVVGREALTFRIEADKWRTNGDLTGVLEDLADLARKRGIGRPNLTIAEMNAVAVALYQAMGDWLTFAANFPQQGETIPNATVTVRRGPPNPDLVVTVPKTQAITNAINAALAAFD